MEEDFEQCKARVEFEKYKASVGHVYWKSQHDHYSYCVFLTNGMIIEFSELTDRGEWVDILMNEKSCMQNAKVFDLSDFRPLISIRKEHIIFISEFES